MSLGAGRVRGRGRGGCGSWQPRRDIQVLPPLRPGQTMLGNFRAWSLDVRDICSDTDREFGIDGCEYLASYNWLESEQVKILVPGAPPAWIPPADSPTLREDSGTYYRDKNSARWPKYPTEPGIRAIFELSPDFQGQGVDIVGCGSTLGSVLAFASEEERTFRFGLEKLGNTVFIVRRTSQPKETIDDVRGYGHSFPEANTTWDPDVAGSDSHQRLIKYSFNGLTCVVRSECDGYLPSKLGSAPKLATGEDVTASPESLLSDLILKSKDDRDDAVELSIEPSGRVIPQSAIFDLKTRGVRNLIKMQDIYPRLWVNQTPNFILAYHDRGKFNDIQVREVSDEIKDWEQDNQQTLGRFNATIRRLIKIVGEQSDHKAEVRRMGRGDLQIWSKGDSWSALPKELSAKWLGLDFVDSGDESSEDGGDDDYLKL